MGKREIKTTLALDGEKEYKQAISDAGRQLRVLASEMKANTSAFGENANESDVLRTKNETLAKQIAKQKEIVATLSRAVEESAKTNGEAGEKTDGWRIKLNNATASLNKMQNDLNSNTAKIESFGKESNDAGEKIEDAGKKAKDSGDRAEKGKSGWSKLGDGLKTAGKLAGQAVAALGAGAAAAATGIAAMTVKAAQSADDISALAKQTGLSTEQIQKFQYASQLIDVDLDTLTGSMAKLTRNMATAQKGTGDAAAAFQTLGISITDQNGDLRNNQDVFNDAIDALGKIENETQRDALAMQIFGKSAQDLNPLILGGAQQLEELGKQAEDAGLILGQDSLNNLNKLSDALDTFKATASGSGSLFATAFAGPMSEGLNMITGYMTDLSKAFKSGGFEGLSKEFGTVLSGITSQITQYLPQVVSFGTQIISKLITGISQSIPEIAKSAVLIVTNLLTSIWNMLPMLYQAAADLISNLALGIADALPQLIPTMVDTMLTIVDTLINNVDMLVDSAIAIIMALADGLINAMPVLIQKAPEIIAKLVTAIVTNAPKLLAAAAAMIGKLTAGIISNLGTLGKTAAQIVGTIVSGIANIIPRLAESGKNMVRGVWQGIKDLAGWFKKQISDFFGGIVDGIKNLFDMHSPARKVWPDLGKNMGKGIGVGFVDSMKSVSRDMEDSIPTDFGSITPSGSSRAGGGVIAVQSKMYLDGEVVTKATSRHQYSRNSAYSRAVGVIA